MIEPPRKHGPFDFRYPVPRKLRAPVWDLQPGEEGDEQLDWSSFLARFFPDRRRHDFEALAWYAAYRKRIEQGPSDQRSATRPPLARRSADFAPGIRGTPIGYAGLALLQTRVRVAASSSAVLAWESEGGAMAERDAD
jgi:hypothetical protein